MRPKGASYGPAADRMTACPRVDGAERVSVALTTGPREALESIVTQGIREGPAAIRETIDVVSTQVVDIANTIGISGRRRIWAIGNGSLFNSLIYMSALARRLA